MSKTKSFLLFCFLFFNSLYLGASNTTHIGSLDLFTSHSGDKKADLHMHFDKESSSVCLVIIAHMYNAVNNWVTCYRGEKPSIDQITIQEVDSFQGDTKVPCKDRAVKCSSSPRYSFTKLFGIRDTLNSVYCFGGVASEFKPAGKNIARSAVNMDCTSYLEIPEEVPTEEASVGE